MPGFSIFYIHQLSGAPRYRTCNVSSNSGLPVSIGSSTQYPSVWGIQSCKV